MDGTGEAAVGDGLALGEGEGTAEGEGLTDIGESVGLSGPELVLTTLGGSEHRGAILRWPKQSCLVDELLADHHPRHLPQAASTNDEGSQGEKLVASRHLPSFQAGPTTPGWSVLGVKKGPGPGPCQA